MKKNVMGDKSFRFALLIVETYKEIVSFKKEYEISRQLLRSGASIGANIKEGSQAESRGDFIHKYAIALKEAFECEYWIDLAYHSKYIPAEQYQLLSSGVKELMRMLTSSIKTAKSNLRKG